MAKAKRNRHDTSRPAGRTQGAAKKAAGGQTPGGIGTKSPESLRIARRISWWALLAMVFLVPLGTSNLAFVGSHTVLTYDTVDIVKMSLERVLMLIALAAWVWDLLRRGGRIRRTPVDWLIGAFLIWTAISTALSIHWPTSLFGAPQRYEGLLTFVTYALIYFLVLQFADDALRVQRLAQALFWASVIVSFYGLLQFAGVHFGSANLPAEDANRAFSTYGNPDMLGGFLIFSVTVALALSLLEERIAWRLVYWVGFGLNGLTLVVSFTRGAWIGAAISIVLVAVMARRQRIGLRRVDWAPAGVFLAAALAIIVRSFSNRSEVMNFGKRLSSIFQFSSGSAQTRTEIWRAAGSAIKAHPVFGWGADTFNFVFSRFKPVEYIRDAGATRRADNAHDYPLQLASGLGIFGALMFYGVFVWAGVRSFRTVFGRSGNRVHTVIIGAFWAASVGYLFHLLFGISVTGVSFLLWIALALVLAPTARSGEVPAHRAGTMLAPLAIIVAVAGIGYQGVVIAADNAYMHARQDSAISDRVAAARKAISLNPFNSDYRSALGIAYLDQMRADLLAMDRARQGGEDPEPYKRAVQSDLGNAETAFDDAIAFVPDEYANYVDLARIYNAAGSALSSDYYQNTISVAEGGLKVMPLGTAIREELGYALLATGQVDDAVKTLEDCMKIDPRDGEAALTLAQAYEKSNRLMDALALLQSVESLAPGQPGVEDAISNLQSIISPR